MYFKEKYINFSTFEQKKKEFTVLKAVKASLVRV